MTHETTTTAHVGTLRDLADARRRGPKAFSTARGNLVRDTRLGYNYLGIGASIVGALLCVRGLLLMSLGLEKVGSPVGTAVAWALIIVIVALACVLGNFNSGKLSLWFYLVFLAVLGIALALDVSQALLHDSPLVHATSISGVGAGLLATVAFRPPIYTLIANTVLLGVAITLLVLSLDEPNMSPLGYQVEFLLAALVPAYLGVVIAREFGLLLQRELDRSLVESTVATPRYSLGMDASEELAALDLAAEELLQEVATGLAPLPLDEDRAKNASSIATELRLALLAGRHETWLHHAIKESEILGPVVTLSDPEGLAGYLDQDQRDALLSAIWLLVGDNKLAQSAAQIDIGPPGAQTGGTALDTIRFPVVITVRQISRRQIDSGVWPTLDPLGSYQDSYARGELTIVADVYTDAPDVAR